MAIVGFDYGHGGADPGAVYKGRREADDVLRVGMETAAIMRRHGVIVDETRTTDKTVDLLKRSTDSNKKNYDYFISFHRNAFKPEVGFGVETFSNPGSSSKSVALSKAIQDELVKVGFHNRGAKQKNLSVLRNTKAPAVLTELGFIDNTKDNIFFDANIDAIAEGIAKGILIQLGIKYKDKTSDSVGIKPSPIPNKPIKSRPSINTYISVDGHWGPATTKALQKALNTTVDGVISGQYPNNTTRSIPSVSFNTRTGSNAIKALQRKIGAKSDGYIGVATVRSLQKYLGTTIDGHISRPSLMVKELQRRLNKGNL